MMKVGDQVVFSNLNKKSTLQIEIFEKSSENKTVWVETYWRGGLFKITFMHDYEIDAFKEILDGGDEYELETDDFEFCELLETYDSQSIEIDSKTFSSVEELDNNGYDITKEYYIIFIVTDMKIAPAPGRVLLVQVCRSDRESKNNVNKIVV